MNRSNFIIPQKTKFLIHPKLTEITQTVKNSMITIINSDKGSGKTIGIPNHLSKTGLFNVIYCGEPTIINAVSSAKYQSNIIGVNGYVGYASNIECRYDYGTKIIYCTYEYLLEKIGRTVFKDKKWFCSVLIIDDFHLRKKDADICLGLWKTAYKIWENDSKILPKPPKLVIMTDFFDNTITRFLPREPSVLSYTRTFRPINIIYDILTEKMTPNSDELYIKAAQTAYDYFKKNYSGIYLIYVPGKQELNLVKNELEKCFDANVDIYCTYKELSNELLQSNLTRQKIIIAIDVIESTISNITLIIDTLTEHNISSANNETLKIGLRYISKRKSKQRMEKIDKKCSGTYVPLMSEEQYKSLSDFDQPEIETILLDYDTLRLIKFGLDPKIVLSSFINDTETDVSLDSLKKMGLVDEANQLTGKGSFCSEFPLGIRNSTMLYHLMEIAQENIFLYLAVICTLNCCLTTLYQPPKKTGNETKTSYTVRKEFLKNRFQKKYAGYSDIDTLFNIWIDICSKINPFYLKNLRLYCIENHLNFRKFREITLLLKRCVHICNDFKIRINRNLTPFAVPSSEELGKTFYNLLAITHQDCLTSVHYNFHGNIVADCDGSQYKVDNKSVHTMVLGDNMAQEYYALVRTERTAKKGNIFRIINILHSIPHEKEDDTPSIFSSDIETDSVASMNNMEYEPEDDIGSDDDSPPEDEYPLDDEFPHDDTNESVTIVKT